MIGKILFYYSLIASLLITASVLFAYKSTGPAIFAFLFLPVAAYFVIDFFNKLRGIGDGDASFKKSDLVFIGLIFLVLLGLGVGNIISAKPEAEKFPSPSPIIFKSEPTEGPKPTILVSINDGSPSINIREKPTIYSERLGEAKDGDTFVFISKENGWYKIQFNDTEGYISNKYVVEN